MNDDEPVRGVFVPAKTVCVTFDMTAPDPREKRLKLTFFPRLDATPEAVAADLDAVCERLSQFEIGLGGKGLVEDAPRDDSRYTHRGVTYRRVTVSLRAVDPAGAWERLPRLAKELGPLAGNYPPNGLTAGDSFIEYVPELIPVG